MIGADSSTGSYRSQLITTQANSNVRKSELSNLYVLFTIPMPTRGEPIQTGTHGKNNPLKSRAIPNFRNSQLTIEDCLNMIQAVYDQKIGEMRPEESVHKSGSSTRVDKSMESTQRGSKYDDGGNTTLIETQIFAGPGATVFDISHEARGEARSTDIASQQERQTHGYFQDSKVFNTLATAGIAPS